MTAEKPRRSTLVAGRLVTHVRGSRTQTVRVHRTEGGGGVEACYRMPATAEVSTSVIREAKFKDVDSLYAWLVARDGTLEPEEAGARGTTHGTLVHLQDDDLDWVENAVPLVDQAITTLVDRFAEHPFLHRVEHSLHTELFALLKEHPLLQGTHPFDGGRQRTQLVHKEWPETHPRSSKGGGRGSFDLAVLVPTQLARADHRQFRDGRIEAPIVIELGLDYGKSHLKGDIEKFRNSKVRHGYLVHFSRVAAAGNADVEAVIDGLDDPCVKVAYAHVDGRSQRIKHLDGTLEAPNG